MGKTFIVSDHDADLLWIRLGRRPIHILKIGIPSTEQSQLHPLAYNRRDILEEEIESLLPRHAADDAEQKCIGRNFETESLLQVDFVCDPLLKMVCIVALGDVTVAGRVPN